MKPRPGTRRLAAINAELDSALADRDLDSAYCQLTRAAVLLWHDHFEAAHELAQHVEGPDGSLVHGILHRREPDFSNARYWFRRVGPNHRSFDCIVGKVKALIQNDLIIGQLLPKDKWQPLGFIDVIEDVSRRVEPAYDWMLRQIQAAEIQCFLTSLPSRVDPILPKRAFGPPSR